MLEMVLAVISKGGKIGASGLVLSGIGKIGVALGFIIPKYTPFFSALDSFGLATAAFGIAFHVKSATDLYVKREAEKAHQAMGPEATSTIPPIQREIAAIQTGVPTSTTVSDSKI